MYAKIFLRESSFRPSTSTRKNLDQWAETKSFLDIRVVSTKKYEKKKKTLKEDNAKRQLNVSFVE